MIFDLKASPESMHAFVTQIQGHLGAHCGLALCVIQVKYTHGEREYMSFCIARHTETTSHVSVQQQYVYIMIKCVCSTCPVLPVKMVSSPGLCPLRILFNWLKDPPIGTPEAWP